jgi:hypothetical protein
MRIELHWAEAGIPSRYDILIDASGDVTHTNRRRARTPDTLVVVAERPNLALREHFCLSLLEMMRFEKECSVAFIGWPDRWW